jgi:hypothetical protein
VIYKPVSDTPIKPKIMQRVLNNASKNKDGFVLPELLRVIYESAKRASEIVVVFKKLRAVNHSKNDARVLLVTLVKDKGS